MVHSRPHHRDSYDKGSQHRPFLHCCCAGAWHKTCKQHQTASSAPCDVANGMAHRDLRDQWHNGIWRRGCSFSTWSAQCEETAYPTLPNGGNFLDNFPRPDLGDLGGRLKDSTTKPAQKSRFRTQIYCVAVQQSAGHDQLLMICIYHLQDSCGLNSDRCHANWGGSKGRKRNGGQADCLNSLQTPKAIEDRTCTNGVHTIRTFFHVCI